MNSELAWTHSLYRELRRMADGVMAGERGGHTLEPTALANEVWLRLQKSQNAGSLDRGALLGLASQAMRRILTEHARRHAAAKRGGGVQRTTLEDKACTPHPQDLALDLDEALVALEGIDHEVARVFELRFYGGCSIEEAGAALSLSPRTVKRRWRFARAWLKLRLLEDGT